MRRDTAPLGTNDPMRIDIRQAWYHRDQLPYLDPAFTPLDNTANPHPDWAEYHLFLQAYEAGQHRGADLFGILSWRFREKSHVEGRRFLDFIRANPGYDVY